MQLAIIWILFFVSTVYGHIAFKWATTGETFSLWKTLFSFWGITASFAWVASGIIWLLLLSKSSLLNANSISALRYGFIALAAMLFFHEAVTLRQSVGMGLVMIGVYLVIQ